MDDKGRYQDQSLEKVFVYWYLFGLDVLCVSVPLYIFWTNIVVVYWGGPDIPSTVCLAVVGGTNLLLYRNRTPMRFLKKGESFEDCSERMLRATIARLALVFMAILIAHII